MNFQIRKVMQGDAQKLAYIQTTSWKSAFKNIITDDDLVRLMESRTALPIGTRQEILKCINTLRLFAYIVCQIIGEKDWEAK